MLSLEEIVDRHKGERFLVCGTGESIDQFPASFYRGWDGITIGVNGIKELFTPDYYINIHERPGIIEGLDGDISFCCSNPSIKIETKKSGLLTMVGTVALLALTLAYQLGAEVICLIGIDFQGGHFKDCTSTHPDAADPKGKLHHFINNEDELKRTIRAFKRAGEIYAAQGVKIINLSKTSLLEW